MLTPIALYPDALLSQVLMAATYPRDVDEAAQWSRRNGDLNGDRAVRAVERYDWDPSVKSLVAFPQILDMMSEKMDWTQDVGDAFLDQQAQVMDTVQYLRRQAYAEGNLRSSDQLRVEAREGSFTIDFMSADYACLPYYDPLVVYGRWWWPARPVYWAPWHGYYARPGYAGYVWGPPVAVGRGFFYSRPDWHARRIEIVNVNNYYYRAPTHYRTAPLDTPHVWQRDNRDRRVYVQREGVRERDGRVPMTFVPQPQARVVAAPPAGRLRFLERERELGARSGVDSVASSEVSAAGRDLAGWDLPASFWPCGCDFFCAPPSERGLRSSRLLRRRRSLGFSREIGLTRARIVASVRIKPSIFVFGSAMTSYSSSVWCTPSMSSARSTASATVLALMVTHSMFCYRFLRCCFFLDVLGLLRGLAASTALGVEGAAALETGAESA